MVLILATTMGVLNLSPRPGTNSPAAGCGRESQRRHSAGAAATATTSGPLPKASTADALDALEPLQRFLNLSTPPSSLERARLSPGRLSGHDPDRCDLRPQGLAPGLRLRHGHRGHPAGHRVGGLLARPVSLSLGRSWLVRLVLRFRARRVPRATRATRGSPARSSSGSTARGPSPASQPRPRNSCCCSWSGKPPPRAFTRRRSRPA